MKLFAKTCEHKLLFCKLISQVENDNGYKEGKKIKAGQVTY